MAWIEDSDRNVLLVRQAAGLKLWTLPGGKVKRGESLVKALEREAFCSKFSLLPSVGILNFVPQTSVRSLKEDFRFPAWHLRLSSEQSTRIPCLCLALYQRN